MLSALSDRTAEALIKQEHRRSIALIAQEQIKTEISDEYSERSFIHANVIQKTYLEELSPQTRAFVISELLNPTPKEARGNDRNQVNNLKPQFSAR